MAKLISEIQHSYNNANGKLVKGLIFGDPKSRFPFEVYSQQCIRIARFLSGYGLQASAILDAFVAGNPTPASTIVGYSEYKEHKLIQLRTGEDDKNVFQFGAGKAKLISEALKKYSMGDMLATLQDAIGDAKPADRTPPKKGKPKGGKGGGKPKLDVEDMEVATHDMAHEVSGQDDELSLDHKIAKLTGLITDLYAQLPMAQAELRRLNALKLDMVSA